MRPKAMSFEPHTHQLSSSGVVGAIKNGGDRLGNLIYLVLGRGRAIEFIYLFFWGGSRVGIWYRCVESSL